MQPAVYRIFLCMIFSVVMTACLSDDEWPCGNRVIDEGEQCDDGNWINGDGCSAYCQLEQGSADSDILKSDKGVSDSDSSGSDVTGVTDTAMASDADFATSNDIGGLNDSDPQCGNSVVEQGELCDGNVSDCSALTGGQKNGIANCNKNCNGWDLSYCKDSGGTGAQPVASMESIAYSSKYIYTSAQDIDTNQSYAIYTSAAMRASVALQSGNYVIPHPQTDTHFMPTLYADGNVLLRQLSYADGGNTFAFPYVVLGIAAQSVVSGKTVSAGIADIHEANLLIMDNTTDPNDPAYDCVILVGFGSIAITAANLTPGTAGAFSISSNDMKLYLTSQTPDGDVRSTIKANGWKICGE